MTPNHLLLKLLFISLILLPSAASAQLLWRDVETLNAGEVMALAEGEYVQLDYRGISGFGMHDHRLNLMLGGSAVDRLELLLNIPFRNVGYQDEFIRTDETGREIGTFQPRSFGISDMVGMVRYCLLPPENPSRHALTLIGGVRVPTGTTPNDVTPFDDLPLGDGSIDYGFGLVYDYTLSHQFHLLVKARHWLNGSFENDRRIERDYGDEFYGTFFLSYVPEDNVQLRLGFSHLNLLADAYGGRFSNYRFYRNDIVVEFAANLTEHVRLRSRFDYTVDHQPHPAFVPEVVPSLQLEFIHGL